MENPELANTSTKLDKKKKSKLYSDKHGGSSEQEEFLHGETDVKPRRSFWKNLFRKNPKKSEVPEMVTDKKSMGIAPRLNAIFEEPKSPEEKEHVAEDIEEIKKSIRKITPIEPTTVLISNEGQAPYLNRGGPQCDDTIIDYLSDASSTSEASLDHDARPQQVSSEPRNTLPPADSGELKRPTEQRDSSLGRDAYSFEYSESSDVSAEDVAQSAEEAKDKVTFDEKVEQKDADSNIVVKDLSPGEEGRHLSRGEEDDDEEEFEMSLTNFEYEQDVSNMVGIVGYSRKEALLASRIPMAIPSSPDYVAEQLNNKAPQTKRQKKVAEFLANAPKSPIGSRKFNRTSSKSISHLPEQLASVFVHEKPYSDTNFEMHASSEDIVEQPVEKEEEEEEDLDKDHDVVENCNKREAQMASRIPIAVPLLSTAPPVAEQSINSPKTKRSQDILATSQTKVLSSSESKDSLEESELWSQKLNELSGLSKSMLPATVIDMNSLDESEAGYRECRLDDFFKMVFRQTADDQIINYSVAYDPIFGNFNVQCRQPHNQSFPTDEKQKVVRKRKMMSLLHDKSKMAEYLKEIEQQQLELNNNCAPQNCASHESLEHKSSTISRRNTSFSAINIKEDENVLLLLENTKRKLQNLYTDKNCALDQKAFSLYPDNCLETFNLITSTETPSTNSDDSIDSVESFLSEIPSFPIKHKQFKNIEHELEYIFEELIGNVSELKDTSEIVRPILAEILENVSEINPCIQPKLIIERSEGTLTDETVEYSYTSETYLATSNLKHFDDMLAESHVDKKYIPRNFIYLLNDSCESDSDPEANDTDSGSDSEIDSKRDAVRQTAENLVESIEQKINESATATKGLEKAKKFGPFYDRKPGKSLEEVDKTKLPKKNEVYKNFRTTDPPEVTDSLKHIFFGEYSGEVIQSEFNLVDEENSPKAGPSTILGNPSLPHLPSVPSTDLYMEEHSDQFASKYAFDSDNQACPKDLVSVGSNLNPNENLKLERKVPETNIIDSEVENMASSTCTTPEGSISILSTITENLLESKQGSQSSQKLSDRYPQFIVSSTDQFNSQNVPKIVPISKEEETEKPD